MRHKILNLIKERDWVTIIGWVFFGFSFYEYLEGGFSYNPFVLGFSYYVIVALSRSLDEKRNYNKDLIKQRILMISGGFV